MLAAISERRIANEWNDVLHLQACNTDVIQVGRRRQQGDDVIFSVTLRRTYALLRSPGGLRLHDEHSVNFTLPRFFPSVPIEAFLAVPVFHPNVEPRSGFVCLWDRYSAGDTVIDAVLRLQRVLTWTAVNLRAEHVLQADAAAWLGEGADGFRLPLPYTELHLPEGVGGLDVGYRAHSIKRQRLS